MSTQDAVQAAHFLPTNNGVHSSVAARSIRPLKAASVTAYAKDLAQYREVFGGKVPCDERAARRYIESLRNHVSPTTIYRRLMALRSEHVRLGFASPTDLPKLRTVLSDLRRGVLPVKPGSKSLVVPKRREPRHVKPLTRGMLAKMLDAMGTDVLDRRDRCLLLLGFSAALSRSALVALDVAHLRFTNDVLVIDVGAQEEGGGKRQTVTVPITGHEMCAATATRAYISHAALDMEGGPLFRSCDRGGDLTRARLGAAWVAVVVKQRAEAVGIESTNLSGLSLRRGRLAEIAKGVL